MRGGDRASPKDILDVVFVVDDDDGEEGDAEGETIAPFGGLTIF